MQTQNKQNVDFLNIASLENFSSIIMCYYGGNVNWLNNCKCAFQIESRRYIQEGAIDGKNIGREASVYLEYIINNYNNLWGTIYFIKDKQFDNKYMTNSLDEIINYHVTELKVNKDYTPGYNTLNDAAKNELVIIDDDRLSWHNKCKKFIEDALDEKIDYSNITTTLGSQFYVTKKQILKRPLDTYLKLYNGIFDLNKDILYYPEKYPARFKSFENSGSYIQSLFEPIWHIIFDTTLPDNYSIHI